MRIRFKHSIRFKIAIIVFVTTLLTILISWALSNHFIERFYVSHTKNMLVETYKSCNTFFQNTDNILKLENDEIVSLDGYIENQTGASIYAISPDNFRVYSSVKLNDNTITGLKSLIEDYKVDEMMKNNDKYKVIRNTVNPETVTTETSGNYYDLVGILDNGFILVLRTPVETVHDNISFSTKLFASVSLALLIFEILIVLIVTNMFSKPIIEMSRVARRMSDMDFSSKVEVTSNDEIGDLGESMNELSYKLENSITELKSANLELSNNLREKEQIEDMRTEFLSHVSHELKTPLAIIQGYAEGLKSGVAEDQETMDYYCDVISDEATKMNELVMRLINLNQIETGNDLSIERFDLTKLIEDVINNTTILLKDRNVNIKFEEKEEKYVWADSFRIEEVITNYLSNAIHYVKDDGEIRLWYEDKKDTVRVNVYNYGDTIDKENLEKLFIKFYKVDAARTRSYGGSGIGLSIVAAIMKSHDKEYGAYNVEDGVVFYFEVDTNSNI
ncbi:MAG: cell wall metabolism sensor histidine kinase WalK [Eubacterium sp.]|nr:cell wall metabolism sensor histidine kinase WalK [Eubacterium sp.]